MMTKAGVEILMEIRDAVVGMGARVDGANERLDRVDGMSPRVDTLDASVETLICGQIDMEVRLSSEVGDLMR